METHHIVVRMSKTSSCKSVRPPKYTRQVRPNGNDRAVARGAAKAGLEPWTPRTFATLRQPKFGLDAAQSVLGHRHASVTEVYTELHTERASEMAAKIG